MIYIGLGTWCMSFFFMGLLMVFEERHGFNLKVSFYRACLEKDGAYFDEHNPNEMAARISKEVGSVQRGIGAKAGEVLASVAAFVFGLSAAMYLGWKLTILVIIALPVLLATGIFYMRLIQEGVQA